MKLAKIKPLGLIGENIAAFTYYVFNRKSNRVEHDY